MNRIQKILIPTNFSACAEAAFDYATRIAEDESDMTLVLLHIVPPGSNDSPDTAEPGLAKLRDKIQSQLKDRVKMITRKGPVVETIINVQKETRSNLIVMGMRDSEHPSSQNISSQVILNSPCPVLMVPASVKTFRIKQIALALDENELDDSFSLGFVHDIARKFGAQVHLLTIDNGDNPLNVPRYSYESTLEYYLETLDYHHAIERNTDIEKGIANYLSANQIDMLVMLPRNQARNTKPSEGKLTRRLTLHCKVPLLTVK